jgi:hypothetical protein
MTTDLLGSLKTYLTKLSDGEKTPQEVAAAINMEKVMNPIAATSNP